MPLPTLFLEKTLLRAEAPDGGGAVGWANQAASAISRLEEQQPEGQRLEVAIVFRELPGLERPTQWVVGQLAGAVNLANELARVDPWPENDRIAYVSGNVLRIRWYKQPVAFAAIWPVVVQALELIAIGLGVAVGIFLLAILFKRYNPLPSWAWLALGAGFVLVAVGPSAFEVLDQYLEERTAYRSVQREALEALT